MKLNPHFKLRSIAGETIIVNQGVPDTDLTRIISFNFSACLLWKRLSGKDFFQMILYVLHHNMVYLHVHL